jgi:hypothetical protein
VLAGPACWCPAAALPHLPLSLPHPVADTGPRCLPTHLSVAPHHVTHTPPPSPIRHRPRRECALPPSTALPGAILTPRSGCRPRLPPLSLFLPPPRGTPEPTPLSTSRARQIEEVTDASLRSILRSSPISSPPSPPPTCLPHQLPPPDTPPPLWSSFERHRLRRFTVRPSHLPPLSPFEAALTFPLPRPHYRAVPPLPPAIGALSPPTNTAARSILHRLYIVPPLG